MVAALVIVIGGAARADELTDDQMRVVLSAQLCQVRIVRRDNRRDMTDPDPELREVARILLERADEVEKGTRTEFRRRRMTPMNCKQVDVKSLVDCMDAAKRTDACEDKRALMRVFDDASVAEGNR